MYYIDSDKIKVFPSSKRPTEQPSARTMSEAALVRLVNKLIDKDGFVISSSFVEGESFEFNIHGYYFNITNTTNLTSQFSSYDSIYANIVVKGLDTDFPYLDGQDAGGAFQGVSFTGGAASTTATYNLKILNKVNNLWTIPNDSKVKFSGDSMSVELNVDGGEII